MRRRTLLAGIATTGTLSVTGCTALGGTSDVPALSSDWPAPRYDERGRGYRDEYAAIQDADPSVRWSAPYERADHTPTPVVHDDVVYVHTGVVVHAYDAADGTDRWRTRVVEAPGSAYTGRNPVTVSGDRVFAGSPAGLSVLDTAGDVLWTVNGAPDTFGTHGAPAVVDGTVYFGLGDVAYAYTVGGEEQWAVPFEWEVTSGPVVGRDGAVYVGTERAVHRLTSDGDHEWRRPVGVAPWTPMAVDRDALYVPTLRDGSALVRLDAPSGEAHGRLRVNDFTGPPVVADVAEDAVYLSVRNTLLETLTDQDLAVAGGRQFTDAVGASMAGRALYVAHGDGVSAFTNLDANPKWRVPVDDHLGDGAVAVTDEAVFVAADEGVYAIA